MALIRCNNCGNMISDRAAKCPKCGIHITTAQTYDASPNSLTGNSPSKNNNNILYLVLAFLFVVILALLGYVIWANKDAKTKEYVESATSCSMCKRLIINSGISYVVIRDSKDDFREIWRKDCFTS